MLVISLSVNCPYLKEVSAHNKRHRFFHYLLQCNAAILRLQERCNYNNYNEPRSDVPVSFFGPFLQQFTSFTSLFFVIEVALSSQAFFFLTDEFAMTQLRALVKLKGSSTVVSSSLVSIYIPILKEKPILLTALFYTAINC